MIICHICLSGPYNEGWTYQENLLSKYHAKLGHRVFLLATPYAIADQGMEKKPAERYLNADGVYIIRLRARRNLLLGSRGNRFPALSEELEAISPNILFVHSPQFLDAGLVANYVSKHPECILYVDNHADHSNSATNWFSSLFLHRILWKHSAHQLLRCATKFYGVLPARVDFLVMTGGKIDQWKTQTLLLMEAVQKLEDSRVRLIVFGSVVPELRTQFDALVDGTKVQYAGWVQAGETYDYAAAADLFVFPGRHSVLWEQIAGQGVPMLIKDWPGTHHVDLGGNVAFLQEGSTEEIREILQHLLDHPEELSHMKDVAVREGMRVFSYEDIARRSIE